MENIESSEIIGEGKQLLEILCKRHRISRKGLIKRYAKNTGIGEDTIKNYFACGIITNQTFKRHIENDLKKSYEEIVDSVKNQIIRKVESVRDNIYLYNDGVHKKVLMELIEVCEIYRQPYYEIIALGNLGRFRANLSLFDEAKKTIKETIKKAKERGYVDLDY